MNVTYKLKMRKKSKAKEETGTRRIRTDYYDHLKKYTREPLADHKKLSNNNHTKELKPSTHKKSNTNVKSTTSKPVANHSRLTTEPSQRPQFLQHHRTATGGDKIAGRNVGPTVSFKKKGKEEKRDEKNKEVIRLAQKKKEAPIMSISAHCNGLEMKGESRYAIEKKVGSGTFGTVHKARDKKTLEVVAIKKVFQDKNYKNRELGILKMLAHPNVLSIKDSYFTVESKKQYLNVVMDFYELNLFEAVSKYSKRQPMPRLKFKIFAYQLFRGLLYLKSISIAHRDIKPQNILVDERTLKLVICDFGSAKQLVSGEPNLAYICSRCYRAPQLIFGNTQYTTQIDMWSVGCVLGEMLLAKPLFQGDSNIDQLVEIIKVLGCPTSSEILQMNPDYDLSQFQLPKIEAKSWRKTFSNSSGLGEEFIDLIQNVLCYSPKKRLSPSQALSHRFFDELRDEKVYGELESSVGLEPLFDFDKTCEGSAKELKNLTPSWWI